MFTLNPTNASYLAARPSRDTGSCWTSRWSYTRLVADASITNAYIFVSEVVVEKCGACDSTAASETQGISCWPAGPHDNGAERSSFTKGLLSAMALPQKVARRRSWTEVWLKANGHRYPLDVELCTHSQSRHRCLRSTLRTWSLASFRRRSVHPCNLSSRIGRCGKTQCVEETSEQARGACSTVSTMASRPSETT